MTAFKKTNFKVFSKNEHKLTPDNLYWKELGVRNTSPSLPVVKHLISHLDGFVTWSCRSCFRVFSIFSKFLTVSEALVFQPKYMYRLSHQTVVAFVRTDSIISHFIELHIFRLVV